MTGAGVILLLSALASSVQAATSAPRIAIVAGANRGGDRTTPLQFAERDAERFARMLREVGGVSPENLILLRGPSAGELERAFDRADALARAARARTGGKVLLVFYYSGHADGIDLEIGPSERFPFEALRRRIEGSVADVRLVFVDSCRSGGLTQEKGLARGPSFDIDLAGQLDATGFAYLTSSSATESAQEAEELQGSYFTHFLVSALRGAADADGNGVVSLGEAYQYTYSKTVRETARTMVGAQHPSYAYRIVGRGDVALTDLRGSGAKLTFPAGRGGEYVVVDERRQELLAEVVVPRGERRRLILPPGTYWVGRRSRDRIAATRFELAHGAEAEVDESRLRHETFRLGHRKGKGSADAMRTITAGYGIVGGALGSLYASHEPTIFLRVPVAESWALVPRVAFGFARVEDRGFRYDYRAALAEVAVLRRLSLPAFDLFVGLGSGAAWTRQRLLSEESHSGLVYRGYAAVAVELPLLGRSRLTFGWDAGSTVARLNGDLSARLLLRAWLGGGYGF